MRKISLLALAMLFIIACQNKPQRYFADAPEIETVKKGIKAYEEGDWDTWASNFADTAKIYHNAGKGLPPKELMKNLQQMVSSMETYGFEDSDEMEMVVDDKGRTWVNYWNTWKAKTKVTGKNLSVPVHLTLQFVDGKIVREYAYYDASSINAALAELSNMDDKDKAIRANIDTFIGEFLNKKNFSVLDDLLSKDFKRFISDEKVATGKDELIASLDPFFKGFSDFSVKLLHTSTIVDNAIFVHWKAGGTHDGEFAGSPATNKKIFVNGLSRLEFDDKGKMIYEHLYFDQLALMQEIGKTLN